MLGEETMENAKQVKVAEVFIRVSVLGALQLACISIYYIANMKSQ